MSNTKKQAERNNDSAFPYSIKGESGEMFYEVGASLRDYFAIKALQGILSDGGSNLEDGFIAKRAYELSDAMLVEREK